MDITICFCCLPSILQHLNIPARAEDDVLLAVNIDYFIICAAGCAGGHTLEGRTFGQSEFGGGRFRLGVGFAHNALKSQPEGEADDRKDG